jgi:hypothetical protein
MKRWFDPQRIPASRVISKTCLTSNVAEPDPQNLPRGARLRRFGQVVETHRWARNRFTGGMLVQEDIFSFKRGDLATVGLERGHCRRADLGHWPRQSPAPALPPASASRFSVLSS